MANIEYESARYLLRHKTEKGWNRQGTCYKVREGGHFKKHQGRIPIRQAAVLIEQILNKHGIVGYDLCAGFRIEGGKVGPVGIAGYVFRRAFMVQPGTLQRLEMPSKFTDLLSKHGIV